MKISLFFGMVFMMSMQPLVVMCMLLMLVIFYSLDTYFFSLSFWFGYILMFILLSGILVIFTYVISLMPNENFEYLSFMLVFSTFLFLFLDTGYINIDEQSVMGPLLWEGMMGVYMIFLGSFLLSVMVMVIFLSNPLMGALRL